MPITLEFQPYLKLLQLTSATLPVGAYSYSEGLETLVEDGAIATHRDLEHWLTQELTNGAIRLDLTAVLRAYQARVDRNEPQLTHWNHWTSAQRESEELRRQSWQMGQSLGQLLGHLDPTLAFWLRSCGDPCNYGIAFGLAAAHWQIDSHAVLLGYLHSWVSNLVSAGVKLIPLGQTAGQQLLTHLQPTLIQTVQEILKWNDDDLGAWSWSLALASSRHETLYTRLFQS